VFKNSKLFCLLHIY